VVTAWRGIEASLAAIRICNETKNRNGENKRKVKCEMAIISIEETAKHPVSGGKRHQHQPEIIKTSAA
jgi:hypothetical protein